MSLKGDKYETLEEIKMRLESSVVLYDGAPVYITRVAAPEADDKKEISRVFFRELPYEPDGRDIRKFLSSRKFDLNIPNLGYINHRGRALYLTRAPVRQYSQGLCNKNTTVMELGGRRSEWSFNDIIRGDGLANLLKGSYPSFKEAGEILNEKTQSVAISKSFAVNIDNDLDVLMMSYKGTKCGLAFKGERAIRLSPKFHFLKNEAEELKIPFM